MGCVCPVGGVIAHVVTVTTSVWVCTFCACRNCQFRVRVRLTSTWVWSVSEYVRMSGCASLDFFSMPNRLCRLQLPGNDAILPIFQFAQRFSNQPFVTVGSDEILSLCNGTNRRIDKANEPNRFFVTFTLFRCKLLTAKTEFDRKCFSINLVCDSNRLHKSNCSSGGDKDKMSTWNVLFIGDGKCAERTDSKFSHLFRQTRNRTKKIFEAEKLYSFQFKCHS